MVGSYSPAQKMEGSTESDIRKVSFGFSGDDHLQVWVVHFSQRVYEDNLDRCHGDLVVFRRVDPHSRWAQPHARLAFSSLVKSTAAQSIRVGRSVGGPVSCDRNLRRNSGFGDIVISGNK